VTVLLATDTVQLYPPGTATDEHGWSLPGGPATWTGPGNLQLSPGVSNPRADDRGGRKLPGGGSGPFGPAVIEQGTLYLPPDADAHDGGTAIIRGAGWVLSNVRLVVDPSGGSASCLAAEVSGWPAAVPSGF
jgi:hypothetical protein